MFDLIAFDADDTLWHNEYLYRRAKAAFDHLLEPYQPPGSAAALLSEIEVRNVGIYGYGIKSFALSMVEAAVAVSQGRVSGAEIQSVLGLAHAMLAAEVDLLDGVPATLEELSQHHDLMIITKGDHFEQIRKVERSGLRHFFRYVEVVGQKTPDRYRELLARYAIPAGRFLMVGNSVRSDILPVVRIGGRAVYIPYEHTWEHEFVPSQELVGIQFDELEHIGLLPGYLQHVCGS